MINIIQKKFLLLFFGLLTFGLVNAQLLNTKSGCKLHHFAASPFIFEVQLIELEPKFDCDNGFVSGATNYVARFVLRMPNELSREVLHVNAGTMKLGKFEGIYIKFSETSVSIFTDVAVYPQLLFNFKKNSNDYNVRSVLQKLNELAQKDQSSSRDSNINYLTTLIRKWDADSISFINDPNSVKIANLNADNTSASIHSKISQTPSTTNSSDNNEALSAQCTAETNRLLREGTQAVSRGNAQQDANMIRRGMLELARNLQTIISTNEGRCREGKSSVSDRFNALKMLQDVSLACNRGGYGADCDREKQEAVQSVVRSQPAPTRSQPTQSTASNSQGSRNNSPNNNQTSGNDSRSGSTDASRCFSISKFYLTNPSDNFCVLKGDYNNSCRGVVHVDYRQTSTNTSINWHQYSPGSGVTTLKTGSCTELNSMSGSSVISMTIKALY